jgi:hypothetical protein
MNWVQRYVVVGRQFCGRLPRNRINLPLTGSSFTNAAPQRRRAAKIIFPNGAHQNINLFERLIEH